MCWSPRPSPASRARPPISMLTSPSHTPPPRRAPPLRPGYDSCSPTACGGCWTSLVAGTALLVLAPLLLASRWRSASTRRVPCSSASAGSDAGAGSSRSSSSARCATTPTRPAPRVRAGADRRRPRARAGTPVQALGRRPRHARRALPALLEPRRAAAAVQRAARPDGARRPAAGDPLRGRDVPRGLPAALRRQAGADRPVAGERPQRAHLRGDGLVRHRVRRGALAAAGPAHPREDRAGRARARGWPEMFERRASSREAHPRAASRRSGRRSSATATGGRTSRATSPSAPSSAEGAVRPATRRNLRPLQPAPPRGRARCASSTPCSPTRRSRRS